MNIEELKRLAAPLVKWGADTAWENPSWTAAVGYIDEDGNRDPILTVDTTIYDGFEGESLGIAQFIAAVNPAAILELIAEIDRLRDEVNGLTGTLERVETERNNQILRNHNLEIELRESRKNDVTAMGWLADCRIASGDNGKRMLPEFVEYLRDTKRQRDEMLAALREIAEWTERYTAPGHPISSISRAVIAKAESQS